MRSIAVRGGFVLGLSVLAVPAAQADQVKVDIRNARQAAECTDKPDRLTVVGEGAEPAEACENGHTSDGCSCQELGAVLLGADLQQIGVDWEARMLVESAVRDAQALGVGPEPSKFSLRLGAGGELNVFKREECSVIEGFSATCDLDRSGLAPLFLVELLFMPWLATGVAFEPLHGVSLERDLVSLDRPGLTGTLRDGHFDPTMVKLYVQPIVALADQLGIYGQVGIGRWWARSGRTITLAFEGQSLVDTTSQEDSGYSAVFGAGLDYWAAPRFGIRLGWEYAKLNKEEANIDTHMHNLRAMFVFKLSGR